MAKSYDFYDAEDSHHREVQYGDWGKYNDWSDALTGIYEHFTPENARDNWSETLFAAGEYDQWGKYLEEYFDIDVDMEAFWEDFREAYSEV